MFFGLVVVEKQQQKVAAHIMNQNGIIAVIETADKKEVDDLLSYAYCVQALDGKKYYYYNEQSKRIVKHYRYDSWDRTIKRLNTLDDKTGL